MLSAIQLIHELQSRLPEVPGNDIIDGRPERAPVAIYDTLCWPCQRRRVKLQRTIAQAWDDSALGCGYTDPAVEVLRQRFRDRVANVREHLATRCSHGPSHPMADGKLADYLVLEEYEVALSSFSRKTAKAIRRAARIERGKQRKLRRELRQLQTEPIGERIARKARMARVREIIRHGRREVREVSLTNDILPLPERRWVGADPVLGWDLDIDGLSVAYGRYWAKSLHELPQVPRDQLVVWRDSLRSSLDMMVDLAAGATDYSLVGMDFNPVAAAESEADYRSAFGSGDPPDSFDDGDIESRIQERARFWAAQLDLPVDAIVFSSAIDSKGNIDRSVLVTHAGDVLGEDAESFGAPEFAERRSMPTELRHLPGHPLSSWDPAEHDRGAPGLHLPFPGRDELQTALESDPARLAALWRAVSHHLGLLEERDELVALWEASPRRDLYDTAEAWAADWHGPTIDANARLADRNRGQDVYDADVDDARVESLAA